MPGGRSTETDPLSSTKRRIVDALKRRALTGPELAARFGLSAEAVRQHLGDLGDRGLVTSAPRAAAGPGRPPVEWSLTDLAAELFPDRHADLTVSLIASIREAVGEEGLDAVIDTRTAQQADQYRRALDGLTGLDDRLAGLAALRSDEGYMAEVARADGSDGSDGRAGDEPDSGSAARLLIEHHCPICEAAETCQNLCRAELDLFRSVLGTEVTITREQHLLSGAERCVYRIEPRLA